MPAALAQEDMQEDLRAVGELSEESKEPINSVIKLRLYPTTTHREKLEHMFATNRAVYNKMVARSKEDCATRLVLRGKTSKDKKMTLAELEKKYKGEEDLVSRTDKDYVRFHPTFFGFGKSDGIELRETFPETTDSIRLQRLREGEYYIAAPRFVEFQPTESSRVCATDPGVRNFATIYGPDVQTFSMKDAYTVLKRRFEVIDAMKSKLASMDDESKAKHTRKVRQRKKPKDEDKTKLPRHRYRLRRYHGQSGGNSVHKCSSCHGVLDRDVNAAKNIFHKSMQMLG
ncbi:hypothetical protein BBJ28_00013554 [Nothophytophthora sp. Chile5]|nr:hypothetical protein BBJ28_00013554 [Nothophytophthora sp. Chile5]